MRTEAWRMKAAFEIILESLSEAERGAEAMDQLLMLVKESEDDTALEDTENLLSAFNAAVQHFESN